MDFVTVVDQAVALLRLRGRVPYCTLKRQCQLDDEVLFCSMRTNGRQRAYRMQPGG